MSNNNRRFSFENVKSMLAEDILFAHRELCRADEDLVDIEEKLIIYALNALSETNEDSDEQYERLWALIYMVKGIGCYFEVNG